MNIDTRENIQKLKDKFKDEHPDALKQIQEWEDQIKTLSDYEDFSKFSTTKAIVKALNERLKEVIKIRALGKITFEEMQSYDARKEEIKNTLNLLLPDFEAQMDEINRQIVDELAQ